MWLNRHSSSGTLPSYSAKSFVFISMFVGFWSGFVHFSSMDNTFRRRFGGHAAGNNRICDVSNRSLFGDKLPFLVSVKTDIQAFVFTALDMWPLILCFSCASSTCLASGRPKVLIIGTVVELTSRHRLWIGDIKSSSAPYVNVFPVSTDFAGK